MMQIINHENLNTTLKLIERPAQKATEAKVAAVVNILNLVKQEGDEAIKELTTKHDGVELTSLMLDERTLLNIASHTDAALKIAIQKAYNNIYNFHIRQKAAIEKVETTTGIFCWRKSVAIEKVGLYIPGGSAPLFSTLLMLAVPAIIANCSTMVLCTPPQKDGSVHPAIAYTALLCGINEIYLCGGAQAVAAMAYGTATIPRAHKIFGPGNQYVTIAKQLIQAQGVAIDMPAGPSEVLVIADDNANPNYIAADLLAQAEHGPDSQVLCITSSANLAVQINKAITQQLEQLTRKSITQAALQNSSIVVVDNLEVAMEISNNYAPEHLIIQTVDAIELSEQVINAGSVFIGKFTPESLGDYASGTNHVLPTSAYANAYSGVSLDSFMKKITFQNATEFGLQKIADTVITMAMAEGLDAHANAVSVRLNNN